MHTTPVCRMVWLHQMFSQGRPLLWICRLSCLQQQMQHGQSPHPPVLHRCRAAWASCPGAGRQGLRSPPYVPDGLGSQYPHSHVRLCPPVHITQHKWRKMRCDVGNAGWMRSPAGQQAHSIFTLELTQKKVLWISLSNQFSQSPIQKEIIYLWPWKIPAMQDLFILSEVF